MMTDLETKHVAILATDGFEEAELKQPMEALKEEGVSVDIISLERGSIKAWDHGNWSDDYKVDKTIEEISTDDYDALVLPGGVINPDKLRRNDKVLQFIRKMHTEGKPIAAICHAAWTLVEAGIVGGKRMTSFHSIKTDLMNAGANWEDKEVVIDENLITSRSPKDLDAFIDELKQMLQREEVNLQTA
jgi:protease I